jgi:hypothetical protein
MTSTALARTVKERASRLDIPCDDIDCSRSRAIARDRFDSLTQKIGQVRNLRVCQRHLVRALSNRRSNAVTKAITKHRNRADQVRAVICSLYRASVAIDAMLGIEQAATIRCSVICVICRSIEARSFRWARLHKEHEGETPLKS